MTKVIFFNLFIDNEWDKLKLVDSIYPIRIDDSLKILDSYQNLGTLIGSSNDVCIVTQKMDENHFRFLNKKMQLAKEIYFNELDSIKITSNEFLFVGISEKEMKILNHFNQQVSISEKEYIDFNDKGFLFSIKDELGCCFPGTELMKLSEINKEDLERKKVIKFLTSAGGRGVFIFNSSDFGMLNYIQDLAGEIDCQIKVLIQDYISPQKHFYTIAHTDEKLDILGFEVEYDKKHSSNIHRIEKKICDERIRISKTISRKLSKLGYQGFFGFDGILSDTNQLYPIIDLNVRLDKSRIIFEIAKKLNLEKHYFEFRRLRFSGTSKKGFNEVWTLKEPILNQINEKYTNEFGIVPILFSNVFSNNVEIQIQEISVMLHSNSFNFKPEMFEGWRKEIFNLLEIINE